MSFGTDSAITFRVAGGAPASDCETMPYGMYISAEGAQAQAQRLEVIANNMANVETAGFKRDVPTFQARFAEAIQQGGDFPGSRSENDLGGGVKMIETLTDFTSGSLRKTGVATDFAINGSGFFKVRGADGGVLLTRAGNFTFDPQGRLITQSDNLPVLDDGGGEIQIDPTLPWALHSGGRILQEGTEIPIGLAEPDTIDNLIKVGQNLFRPLGAVTEIDAPLRDIRQEFLEQSGVNATRETMKMIEASRAFEANTRLIQHQDSMISGLINRVLATA